MMEFPFGIRHRGGSHIEDELLVARRAVERMYGGSTLLSIQSDFVRTTARSMMFRSSRTFPGQGYCFQLLGCFIRDAFDRVRCFALNSLMKLWASRGTSSWRSRSGGIAMEKTFSR